jgi:geranylgeranyl transferase type-2 subunit beta
MTENLAASNEIPFCTQLHLGYIRKVSSDTESFEYLVTQHLRMSGVYWGLTSLSLLGIDLKQEPSYVGMVDWIVKCQDVNSGG